MEKNFRPSRYGFKFGEIQMLFEVKCVDLLMFKIIKED